MAPVIVIIGPPGAGKGVQSDRLAQRTGGIHLSSGEILRLAHDAETDHLMAEGQFVDMANFTRLVEPVLRAANPEKPLILDGFIRLPEDEAWLEQTLHEGGRKIDHILLVNVSQAVAEQRIRSRGRADDTVEALTERWRDYERDTLPLIEQFRAQGRLLEVDGDGNLEQVEERIKQLLV
jgi:adenylate kinase